uniref:Uncharacterized protein n=1 Tax=Glossina palpalis gambiensis TaxID=67801 RepID=A0A1B0BJP9_9MUSC
MLNNELSVGYPTILTLFARTAPLERHPIHYCNSNGAREAPLLFLIIFMGVLLLSYLPHFISIFYFKLSAQLDTVLR